MEDDKTIMEKCEMDEVKILEIKQSVFKNNDDKATALRKSLKERGVFLLNLMSSPGSGKTTTLKATIGALKDKVKIGVMEADIDSDVDAKKIAETGVKSIQLHTGGMCHLDAEMTRQGLEGLNTDDVELAILENVGNLVCPAEFDTGAVKNAMILSVPEGDDKPLKYPLMFSICDVVLINKIDVLPYFDFDVEKCKEYVKKRNPNAKVFLICAKTGEGIAELHARIAEQLQKTYAPVTFVLPFDRFGLVGQIRPLGRVINEEYTDTGLELTVVLANADRDRLVSKYGKEILKG